MRGKTANYPARLTRMKIQFVVSSIFQIILPDFRVHTEMLSWWGSQDIREEMKEHADKNETGALYKELKQVPRDFKLQVREIKNKDDTVICDKQKILER